MDHLERRVAAADSFVTPDSLRRTSVEVDYRLDECRATDGAPIKTYLNTKKKENVTNFSIKRNQNFVFLSAVVFFNVRNLFG